MELLNIDFKQNFKLIINGKEYMCSNEITCTDHMFNNAGTKLNLKKVYPKDYAENDLFARTFKIEPFSIAELYFGDKLFFFGFVKVQNGGSLDPLAVKTVDITIVSAKELLIYQPIDKAIFKKTPKEVIELVVNKLNYKYIKVGDLTFENDRAITAYNTKDMSAFDVLRFIEKQTNSALSFKFEQDKTVSINYFSRESIKDAGRASKGVDIDFTTEDKTNTFVDKYDLNNLSWKQSDKNNFNTVRVESQNVVSSRAQIIEIDLSNNQKVIPLQFKVGEVDKVNTIFYDGVDENGQPIVKRKITITTQKQKNEGKPSDLAYSFGNNTIELNERLFTQAPTGKISFSYFPISRQNVDFEDKQKQNELQVNSDLNKEFETFRYEKHNDITSGSDLIAYGIDYLAVGVANKIKLIVESVNPIWNIGQHASFNGANDQTTFDGDYVIVDVTVKLTLVESVVHSSFKYTLSNIKNLESDINFYDSQSYRDNPIAQAEDLSIDTSLTISDKIILEANNLIRECEDISYNPNEFDYDLDFNVEIDTTDGQGNDLAKYRILQV